MDSKYTLEINNSKKYITEGMAVVPHDDRSAASSFYLFQ